MGAWIELIPDSQANADLTRKFEQVGASSATQR